MADLANLLIALAALVIPLALAYLLTVWTDRPRPLWRPKAQSGKQAPETRTIQE